jgi:hypothetical protein
MRKKLYHFNWISALLIIASIALVAIPRLAELDAFVAFDEPLYWLWTNQFFQALIRGDLAGTLVGVGNPGITPVLLQCLALIVKYLVGLLSGEPSAQVLSHLYLNQNVIVFDEMVTRRLPMVLSNVIVVLLLLFLVYRQFGRNVTLVSTILLGLDPFLLSDSRTMRGDALMSTLMTVSAIGLLIYVHEGNRRYLLLSAFTVGLAFANKFSSLAMLPFVLVMVGVLVFLQTRRIGWRYGLWIGFVCLAFWGGSQILMLLAMWPALWVVPREVFDLMAQFVTNTTLEGRFTFFMGHMYTNQLLPFFYVVIILLRISPLVLVGLIVGSVGIISGNRLVGLRQQLIRGELLEKVSPTSRAVMTIGALLTYTISIWLIMTIGILKRDHYVMPAFPALDILGGIGLVWLIGILVNALSSRFQRWQPSWLMGVSIALLLALQATIAIPHHPYYYSYYNPLILGSRWAPRVTMINWGPDLGEAAHYVNARENAKKLKVASSTVRKFIPQVKGTVIRFVYGEPWIQADYLVVPFEDVQLNKINPNYYDYATRQRLAREVILGGITFAWIYEGPAAKYYVNSKLDGVGLLLGYNLDKETVSVGESVPLKVFWQNDGAGADDLFFVRLSSADGYAWAEALVQPWPGYEEAALTDEAIVEGRANLEIQAGTPPGLYFLSVGFRSAKTGEVLGTFQLPSEADKLTVTRPANPLPPISLPPLDHQLDVLIAPEVKLLGYNLQDDILTRSETNWLTLFWQAEATTTKDYVVALQLFDAQAQEVAYWLGRPVMSGYPTTAWSAGELVRDPWRLDLPNELPPGEYTLQLTLFDPETETQINQIPLDIVSVMVRRQQFNLPPIDHPVNVSLGHKITLLGYDMVTEPIVGGGRLRVTLYWQPQEIIKNSYVVFVHLLGPDGVLVAQHDGIPVEGTIPTNDWVVGEVITDRHQVEFTNLLPGEYKPVVGMYDPITGKRLLASNEDTVIWLQPLSIGQ